MLQNILILIAECRFKFRSLLTGFVTQKRIHRRRIHDLVRIKNPFRVPPRLQFPHQLVILLSYHPRDKFPSQTAISVFPRKRTLKFLHKSSDLLRNMTELLMPFLRLQVDDRTQMQFTRSCVRIMHAIQIIGL